MLQDTNVKRLLALTKSLAARWKNRSAIGLLQTVLFVGVQMTALLFPQTAWSNDDHLDETKRATSHELIDAIDRSLMLELIKLARFNIRFQQQANRRQNWRSLAYAAGRESGTAVSFASSLIDLKQRVRGLDDPSLISRNALKNAVATALVGNAISGSASGVELAQNMWVMSYARKHGYSPKASVAFVRNIVLTTDKLFADREHLIVADSLQHTRRAYELHGVVLRRIRQQLIFEFCTWSCHSRDRAWRENTFFCFDALQNFTRMSAAIIALKAFSRTSLGGGSAITTVVANSVATLNPLVSGLVGYAVRKYQLKKLSKDFSVDRAAMLPGGLLAELSAEGQDSASEKQTKLLEEAMRLSNQSRRLDAILDREITEIERLQEVAQQQTIAGPLIGLASVPGSVLGTVAFYRFRKDRDTTNELLFAGRIPALSGQAYALVQTPYTMISGMLKNRKLKRLGELPSQLLAQRLENLDRLEDRIRSTAP